MPWDGSSHLSNIRPVGNFHLAGSRTKPSPRLHPRGGGARSNVQLHGHHSLTVSHLKIYDTWAVTSSPCFLLYIGDGKLPNYIGIMRSHYKDPCQPTSTIECQQGFERCSFGKPPTSFGNAKSCCSYRAPRLIYPSRFWGFKKGWLQQFPNAGNLHESLLLPKCPSHQQNHEAKNNNSANGIDQICTNLDI